MIDIKVLASGSKGNCYHIDDGTTQLLLEAGIPLDKIKQGLKYKLSKISGALVTHEHMDHAKAVKDLLGLGIEVYASQGMAEALGVDQEHYFRAVQSEKALTIGSFVVLPFATHHDVREPLGFLIKSKRTQEKLLFFTDTVYLDYVFSGVNYIIGECNFSKELLAKNLDDGKIHGRHHDRVYSSHMSLETFVSFLEKSDRSSLRQIYLAHLSDDNSDEVFFKDKIRKVSGAEVIIAPQKGIL